MEILPKSLGTRPRLAVEIRWGGVIAARADDASAGIISQVQRIELHADAIEPGLKAGNFKERALVVAAVRRTLEAVTEKGLGREVTLVVPDATVRVLLLDFDTLPTKAAEALPVVRFRLKKLLPFDADGAALSYQVMSGTRNVAKGQLRVVAVAIPREVLEEYEEIVRDAGFEPGAVLPSTLAALSGLTDDGLPTLVVNAGPQSVTTAIVESGVLLLHRSVDMSGNVQVGILAEAGVVMPDAEEGTARIPLLPLIDVDSSQQEWAMQEPVDPYGRDFLDEEPTTPLAAAIQAEVMTEIRASGMHRVATNTAVPSHIREVTQAVSVAAAYFEDTLAATPDMVLSAGSTSAEMLAEMLEEAGFGEISDGASRNGAGGPRVREIVDSDMLIAQAVSAQVPLGWLAGVRGALRS